MESTTFKMSGMATPSDLEVAVSLVEWAGNMEMSTHQFFIQWPIVAGVYGFKGLLTQTNHHVTSGPCNSLVL